MNKNIVGDPRIFAIEYWVLIVDPSPPFGDCILWLGGNSLGGLEGEVFLTLVCKRLEGISLSKNELYIEENLYNLSDAELFDLMQKEEIDQTGKFWFMYTEGFDLFNKYVYRRKEMFHFLWKLVPEVQKEYELQGFSTLLFSFQVAISVYEEVVRQFKNLLTQTTYNAKNI